MQILDGKFLAAQIKAEIKSEVDNIIAQGKRAPHLVAVLVGSDPASQTYVKSKAKHAESIGIRSSEFILDESTSQSDLMELIEKLNKDNSVDGYIVQLPLPKHLDESKIIEAVDPSKDVDGFHPVNLGLMVAGNSKAFIPATPFGIMEILKRYNIPTAGKKVAVIGRSLIVGTPISILMSRNTEPGNATVTMLHSKSTNVKEVCLDSDIIIAAIGKKNFVTADMVKEGAVIIDVGINRVDGKIYGDVDFEHVAPKCAAITPVPGGVGLLTITSLLQNTLKSYQLKQS
ncbi:MAG: bifunctional 5,10-methylenetetrahydrofolate dehydrogenase/5,10-methenyltetrahydrofolate cyclohydrolase [Chitinophagales bacterium]|nr:bifunctional 5,10-methylenetetrahydrofolate dehydrogenase/5,10-methenyltetrahydrofolate cyclohydrolase [Chitinophagales bacterium]